MIIKKEFRCTTEDVNAVILELAKEIENGWRIESFKDYNFQLSVGLKAYPEFSVTLVRRKATL